jgi:hypothetical protein
LTTNGAACSCSGSTRGPRLWPASPAPVPVLSQAGVASRHLAPSTEDASPSTGCRWSPRRSWHPSPEPHPIAGLALTAFRPGPAAASVRYAPRWLDDSQNPA